MSMKTVAPASQRQVVGVYVPQIPYPHPRKTVWSPVLQEPMRTSLNREPFGHARIAVGVRGAICVWTHRAIHHARIAVGVRGAICVWTHRAIRPRAYRRRRAWCHVYGPIGPFGHARIAVGVRGAICVWTHRAIRPRAYRRRRAWCHLCMDP